MEVHYWLSMRYGENTKGESGTFEGMMAGVHRDGHYPGENGQIKLGAAPDVESVRVYEGRMGHVSDRPSRSIRHDR